MRPPRGFESEQFPLRHILEYAAGLSATTETMNSVYFPLVKHYKTTTDATTVDVNPHHANFVIDNGAVCRSMSIIDQLELSIQFSYTKTSQDNGAVLHAWWRPVFFQFPEKMDAADDKTGDLVSEILHLTKDATEEDITAVTSNNLDQTGSSKRTHPVSTVNLAEAFTHLNMTTDLIMEDVAWNEELFQNALRYYTNKGALKACVGRTRHFTLDQQHRNKRYFLRKFVPKSIRRIMPYTYMAILCHVPTVSAGHNQFYSGNALTASVAHIGVQAYCRYHEWHSDFNQKMVDQS